MSGTFEARVRDALHSDVCTCSVMEDAPAGQYCSGCDPDRVAIDIAAAADWALAKRSLRAHGFDRIAHALALDSTTLADLRGIVMDVAGEISEKKRVGG